MDHVKTSVSATKMFIIDHWRGQFGLVASFWGILVYPLIIVIGGAYLLSVFNVIQDQVISTRLWLCVAVFFIAIYLPWASLGALRSIWLHFTRLQARSGALGILFCWLIVEAVALQQVYSALPVLQRMWIIAFHGETNGLTIDVHDEQLILSGTLTYGSDRKVRKALRNHKDIKQVELNLIAPHLHEARSVADILLEHRLDTLVKNNCSKNCLLIFAAGHNRIATQDAHFEFFEYLNYKNGYRTEWLISRERERDRRYFVQRGANLKFSYQLFYRYNDNAPYVPKPRELQLGGLLSEVI